MRGGAVLCVLLLSLAWLGRVWGAEGGEEDGEVVATEEEEGDEEDEVLSDELEEEDGVLVLHEHNFARALREHRLLLVEFYAPWCGHCRRLAPEFARAAALLRNGSEAARLGKVDAVAQTALSAEFHIEAFPTLKLFRDGNRTHPVAYSGRMDAEGMVLWVQRRAGPSATLLHDADTAAAFVSAQDIAVVGFFKDLRSEAARAFYEVAVEVVEVVFGVAEADELFKAYGLSADTVCLFKKFDEGRTDFPVDPERGLDVAELTRLLRVHSLQLVMDFSNETSGQIFGAKIPNHMLLFLNTSVAEQQALRDDFRAAASAFRGEVLFVVVDVDGYGATVLPFFGLKPSDAPTLRFIKMENNRKYRMEEDDFSAASVRDFVRAVLDGKVKPQLLSAEPPEDWNTRPVKVLVGKTFEQVAFDETKNVFVKFYAPWCTHCQEMAAAWEELGERYKDHEDIVIAEMDATANELENITISGYPTMHYFPAGPGRKMVEYRSARDVETFSKFLENGGKLPEEPPTVSKAPENSTESPSPSGTAEAREEL
ncbi:protein disulfide-isomerase A2 [Excalfactoria chinensis]|uniref:protein disulfide-isomerase A2 n=1 Tax=Excalfactoria chinensis TaxID=46218 RepID=UPI003B3A0CD5